MISNRTKGIYKRIESDYPTIIKSAYKKLAGYAESHMISERFDCSTGEAISEALNIIANSSVETLNKDISNEIFEFINNSDIAFNIERFSDKIKFQLYLSDISDHEELTDNEIHAFVKNMENYLKMDINLKVVSYSSDNIGKVVELAIIL